jgi:hypothetical protein
MVNSTPGGQYKRGAQLSEIGSSSSERRMESETLVSVRVSTRNGLDNKPLLIDSGGLAHLRN